MPGTVELAWTGDVDLANITAIRHELDAALDRPGIDRLVVDLAAVTFVDSLGLGMLMYARDRARVLGIGVSLRRVPAPTLRLLRIAGLDEVLTITAD